MVVAGRASESPVGLYFRALGILVAVEVFNELISTQALRFVGLSPLHWSYHIVKFMLTLAMTFPLVYFGFLRPAFQVRDTSQRARVLEQRYQSVFDNNPYGLCSISLDGRFLTVNESFTKIVGRSLHELMEFSPSAIVNPGDMPRVRFHFWKSVKDQVQTYEISLIHRNGHLIDVIVTHIPMGILGKVDGIYVIVQDITLRRVANDALKEKTEQLESFIRHNNDSILVFDRNGVIQRVNGAFEQMYGWLAHEVIGQQLPFLPNERRDEVNEIIDDIQRGELVTGFETIRKRKDGTLMNISLTVSPLHDSRGNIVAFSAVSRNITAQKQAEEELRTTKEMLESFINNTTDAILVQDMNDKILQVNPAYEKMFGWTANELIGGPVLSIPNFLEKEYRESLQTVRDGGTIAGFETVGCRKDGELVDINVSIAPIRDSTGKVVAVSAIKRDVTDSKKTKEALRRMEKLRVAGQLAAGIGHELRNPMTAIKGFIQLLHSQIREFDEYFEIVTGELNHMDAILNEFLLLAKPKTKHFHPENIYQVIQETVELMQTHAIMNSQEIAMIFDGELGMIHCDESQIKQVLVNVLKNSIEAMKNTGIIEVRTIRDKRRIAICIRDEGEGIPQEVLNRLGEPFYTTKDKGTGLGLSLCYKIIEDHAGKLTVESQLGVGTIVVISLPLVEVGET